MKTLTLAIPLLAFGLAISGASAADSPAKPKIPKVATTPPTQVISLSIHNSLDGQFIIDSWQPKVHPYIVFKSDVGVGKEPNFFMSVPPKELHSMLKEGIKATVKTSPDESTLTITLQFGDQKREYKENLHKARAIYMGTTESGSPAKTVSLSIPVTKSGGNASQ